MFPHSSLLGKIIDTSQFYRYINLDDEFIDSDVDEIPLNKNNVLINSDDEYNNNDVLQTVISSI